MVGKAFHLFPGDTRMMDRERFLQTSLGFGVLHLVGCSSSTGPEGTYICRACLLPLFLSETKYDSGTGWPSFWDPIEGQLGTRAGVRFGFAQIEYHCRRCGGHQGHIFGDGPQPTGTRYCNNGVALVFVPEGESLPALRT